MAQLALTLRQKTQADRLILTTNMVTEMGKNATLFDEPDPPLTELTNLATAVRAKQALVAAAQTAYDQAVSDLEKASAALDAALTAEGKYIESKCKGDRAKLLLSGAPLKGDGAPLGRLPAPGNLRLTGGDAPGELEAMCDPVYGASAYFAQIGKTANGPFTQAYAGTNSKCTLSQLTSGEEYFVQMAAMGAAGLSPWSDIARKRAS